MTAAQASDPAAPTALDAIVERAVAMLRADCAHWAQGLRQDAVESAPRIGWLRQISPGVRVPVHALYFVHGRRRLEAASRWLIEAAASELAARSGRSSARLVLIGHGLLRPPEFSPAQLDITLKRGLFEAEVTWRRRFEAAVIAETTRVTEQIFVASLRALAAALEAGWAAPLDRLAPAPDRQAG